MEYKYSTVIDPSTYETQGLCDGIPLRMHKYSDLEDIGTIRAQEDWSKGVHDVTDYRGGMGPKYSFMSVSVPECLPERLEIISYANEFAFLHDDITDNVDQEKGDVENDEMMSAFREGATSGAIESRQNGKKQIQSKMLLEMLALDRERALTTMKAWAKFVEIASGRQHHTKFATLDEYIPYRIMDVGEMFWFGMVTFGMAITIPDEEVDLCRELMKYAWMSAGLQNDLFSYDKEYEASRRNGQPDVVNAVWVLMGEHNISVDEAKDLCRVKIKECVAKYLEVIEDTKHRTDISPDLRKYVEAMQYSLSGNVAWSITCPRYHPRFNYNELQLSRMKYGVGRSPIENGRTEASYASVGKVFKLPNPTTNGHVAPSVNGVDAKNNVKSKTSKPVNGTKPVNGFHDTNGIVNGHEPVNGAHKKRKASLSNKAEAYNGKPRLNGKPEEIDQLTSERELPSLGNEVVSAPFKYLTSLPSKGVRDQAVDALNVWIRAPEDNLSVIKRTVGYLHNASLMLDDFQDSSPLRRGKPATHTIFGAAQTINSANYWILEAVDEVRRLSDPQCLNIFIDELRNLYVGQGFDLYWTYNVECPTVEEHLKMIDCKTGGLFRLLARLMTVHSTVNPEMDLGGLPTLLGRYFQIRDDYQNLVSADYTKAKGFCEDLDEGKYSLPLIHALQNDPDASQLRSILIERRVAGKSKFEHKQLVLDHLKQTKSLEFTASVLKSLHGEIDRTVKKVEQAYSTENFPLRLLLTTLSV